jgi:cytochrome c
VAGKLQGPKNDRKKHSTFNAEQQLNLAGNLSTGVWHHLAVTLSGSTGVLYVGGVPANTVLSMTLTPSSLGSTSQNYRQIAVARSQSHRQRG